MRPKYIVERLDTNEFDRLREILDVFNNEIINESGGPTGSIED